MDTKDKTAQHSREAGHTPERPLFCEAASEDYGTKVNIKWMRFDKSNRRIYGWESYDSAVLAAAPELRDLAEGVAALRNFDKSYKPEQILELALAWAEKAAAILRATTGGK